MFFSEGEDQWTGVNCNSQLSASQWGHFSQCALADPADNDIEFYIISALDKKVVEKNSTTGAIEMRTR